MWRFQVLENIITMKKINRDIRTNIWILPRLIPLTITIELLYYYIYIPVQNVPLPLNPELHVQVREPIVLLQVALS